ncbi:MAG: TIGR00730 family Rossman fold protein [Planctomycetota bacterium]|nr:TIGR00730 family Rossman fold protein [Planctomycetota bacterium]
MDNNESRARAVRINALKESASNRQAHLDPDFMGLAELRPVRLQVEMMKPEITLRAYGVNSTIVAFGGTRIIERPAATEKLRLAEAGLAESPEDPDRQRDVRIAQNVLKKCNYYDEARELGRIVSSACQTDDNCDYVVVTGGGPGIMEAANRGAYDVGAKSIGLNITILTEQEPNSYISPELCFEFKYFAIRKMHFLMRAKAMIAFPGGFGTMDELFETLTLIQTKKMDPIPVILFGKDYWDRLINWDMFVDEGTIAPEDLKLLSYAETAAEVWEQISQFYRINPQPKLPRGQ